MLPRASKTDEEVTAGKGKNSTQQASSTFLFTTAVASAKSKQRSSLSTPADKPTVIEERFAADELRISPLGRKVPAATTFYFPRAV